MTLPKFSNEILQKSLGPNTPQSRFLVQKFLKFERAKLISKMPIGQYRVNPENFERFAAEITYSKSPHKSTSDHYIQKIVKKIRPNNYFSLFKNSIFSPKNKKLNGKEVYKSKNHADSEILDLNKQPSKDVNKFFFSKPGKDKCKSKIDLGPHLKITESSGDWEKNINSIDEPLESAYQSQLKYKVDIKASSSTIMPSVHKSNSTIMPSVHKSNVSMGNDFGKYNHDGKRVLVIPSLASIHPLPSNENNNNEGVLKSNVGVIKKINNHRVLLFQSLPNSPKNTPSQSNNIFMLSNLTNNTEQELDEDAKKNKNVYLFPIFGEAQNENIILKPKSIYKKMSYQGI